MENKFRERLENALPEGLTFGVQHIVTFPHKSRRLVYVSEKEAKKKNIPLDTVWNHLVLLSYDHIIIYALEVYVFESVDRFTLFVSRADTTGYYNGDQPLSIAAVTRALLQVLIGLYSVDKPLRVCLFAKAEPQYLFPGSNKNAKKHVLSDAGLVKWWAKVLDDLGDQFVESSLKARLQIPGADPSSIKNSFPPSSKIAWQVGDVLWSENSTNIPAIKIIPRFPDDPKTRFLEFLVAERRSKKVLRDQFWLELSSRQEFRLGTTVGIFGLEGLPKDNQQAVTAFALAARSRKYKDLKELMLSLDYSTEEDARSSSEELWNKLGLSLKLHITGKLKYVPRPVTEKRSEPLVNLLNTSLIRKKKKTS